MGMINIHSLILVYYVINEKYTACHRKKNDEGKISIIRKIMILIVQSLYAINKHEHRRR